MTWRTLLVVVLFLNVLPIWVVSYLPTQDGPAHIYNSHVYFAHFDRSNYQIRQFYNVGYQLYPNMLSHLMLGGLQFVVPPLIAEKLVVSLIVTLVPLSLLYLLNSIERGRGVMCLIGLTFAYHNLLHIGFYNFSLSVSLCLFALGWWWRYKDRMTLTHLGGFYLLAALTYVSHFAGFMVLVVAITITVAWTVLLRGLMAIVHARRGTFRQDARQTLLWGVNMTAILLPVWLVGWDYNYRYYDPEHEGYQTLVELNRVFWETLTLMSYSDWHLQLVPIVLWTTAGVAGITILYRLARLKLLQERDALLLTCAALVYLYFTLPWGRNAGGWVNDRLYILAFLLAWAWFGRFHKIVNVFVGIALVGIAAAHTGRLTYDYWRLQPDLRELAFAMNEIEPHSTVAWELNGDYRPATFPKGTQLVNPWLHALSYYGLQKDIALYSNYEAAHPYFMTSWGEAERRDPDYIVAFGMANAPDRIARHLAQYQVVKSSPNLSLLRRTSKAADLSQWTTLPDGRRSLRLSMGRAGNESAAKEAGVQRVPRERLFATGGWGWVRTFPRRDWRGQRETPATTNLSQREYIDLQGDERDRTFRIDLPNGRYHITYHFAVNPDGAYETRVITNDRRVGTATVPDAGEPQILQATVDVTSGQLTQTFYTTWRASPDRRRLKMWAISGIEIDPAEQPPGAPVVEPAQPAPTTRPAKP